MDDDWETSMGDGWETSMGGWETSMRGWETILRGWKTSFGGWETSMGGWETSNKAKLKNVQLKNLYADGLNISLDSQDSILCILIKEKNLSSSL